MSAVGQWIVDHEARRDSKGRIRVYYLPSGDGGGRFEVAGINERYHPVKARRLVNLIEHGYYIQAEREAVEYIDKITSDAEEWTGSVALQAFLKDTIFNRGVRGAGTILQLALNNLGANLVVDGKVGPKTLAALREYEDDTERLIYSMRWAREKYERSKYPWKPNARDESSKFWKGLVNRWNAVTEYALTLLRRQTTQIDEPIRVRPFTIPKAPNVT